MSENTTQYVNRVGTFTCVVGEPNSGWFGEAGEKKTPFIRLPLIVTSEGDQKGKEIIWSGYMSDAAFDYTVKALAKAFPKWNGDLGVLAGGGFSFAGMECEIVTKSETYDNKPRIKIEWLNALGGGGGGGKSLETEKVESLVKKLGRRSLAVARAAREDKPASTASKPVSAPDTVAAGDPSEPPEDDDIPF